VDILLLEPLVPEAMNWLQGRHAVTLAPELRSDQRALRSALYKASGLVIPREVTINRELLDFAPKLQVVARLQLGTDNTDLEACRERGIRVINPSSANVRSNAEYLLGCLVMLFRRGMVSALTGRSGGVPPMGRELHGSVLGLLGLAPTAHALAPMLRALGVRVIGYDPAIHYSAAIWENLRIEPVSLADLMSLSDSVSVQMLYASRYRNFVGENVLAHCKRGQIWVGISRSALFEPVALAEALGDGRIEACMLDSAESGFAGPDSPLHDLKNLFLTPRLGSYTREARVRASWYVAHRLHQALENQPNGLDRPAAAPVGMELPSGEMASQWAEPDLLSR
jgi:D-3-phosphoglycerate dehydrogenase